MVRPPEYFKDKFIVGYKITEDDYQDWLDSFYAASGGIPVANIVGLNTVLNEYMLTTATIPAGQVSGLATAISNQTSNFLTSVSPVSMLQVTGLLSALAGYITVSRLTCEFPEFIADTTPGNVQDSVNKIFKTRFKFIPYFLGVYKNGIRQRLGTEQDYYTTDDQYIHFIVAPAPGDWLLFEYYNAQ